MSLKYLLTILYRPRETMRRILDNPGSRWTAQIIILASTCASMFDPDTSRLFNKSLPDVKLMPIMAIIALSLVVQALSWIVFVLFVAVIALPVGRFLGGTARFRDVTTALAWGLVPTIWSPIYRIPFGIIATRLHVAQTEAPKALLDVIARGGCSYFVAYLFFQVLFEIACVIIGSFTLAEAQQFSTQKGFANVLIALVLPFLVAAAAVFTFRS
jgi:hypothetical protein